MTPQLINSRHAVESTVKAALNSKQQVCHQYSKLAERLAARGEGETEVGAIFTEVKSPVLQHRSNLNKVRAKNSEQGINEFFSVLGNAGKENINQALDR